MLSILKGKEPTQSERNDIAAQLVPIINMLLSDNIDSVPPAKPSLTTPVPAVSNSDTQDVEVNGEAGSKVYVNGVQVGTIGSNGKTTITLTFVNGNNNISITLKDNAANESDALTFSVSYDAPPVITIEGDLDIYIKHGSSYVELGATAVDANDGTVSVSTVGTVDTTVAGDYNVTYSATDSHGKSSSSIRKVHVLPVSSTSQNLPMDLTKVDGFGGATEPSKLAGVVTNQYWVQAFGTLTEAELRAIVSNYRIVTILGYSDTYGLLVEIPLDNVEAKSAIASIRLEEKVLNVRHRVYHGADTIKPNNITLPKDDVSGYFDNGDNWHLEYIDILHAWEIATGSSDVAIGVVDGGFYAKHEDITIKTKNNYGRGLKDTHGTSVASIIAADTNNGKGITGINWRSSLVVSIFKDFDTKILFDPENYFRDIFELSEDHSKAKLVNCSYGPHPKSREEAYKESRTQYDATQKYKNKLFIYAAGNEHNDSSLTYGALHLNRNLENMTQKDNILIVAAVLKDGTLPFYSNYGKTVDIAAPTGMKAAKSVTDGVSDYEKISESKSKYYGTDNREAYKLVDENGVSKYMPSTFIGTSAAAPVVTGVASLIYSLNPNFTPQEVKKILLDSTGGRKVCIRHASRVYTDENDQTEGIPGGHCIPILNAGNALTLAKQIVDAKKATLLHYYPSVFSNICHVYVNPPSQLKIKSLELNVQGQNRTDKSWESIDINPSDSALTVLADNTHELAFPTDRKYSQYKITGTLIYEGYTSIDVNLTLKHTLVEDYTDIKDKLSQEYLDGVEVRIDYLDGWAAGNVLGLGKMVDKNLTLYFEQGREYKATLKKDNYKPYTEYVLESKDSKLFNTGVVEMVSSASEAKGNLIVLVKDENATPISNASVALASKSTIINLIPNTNTSGIAKVLDVPILDINDEFIVYTLEVVRAGYITKTVEGIGLVDGKSPLINITLKKDPNYTNIPPVARAGEDQNITLGQSITLSASASSDVETAHANLAYKWSGPSIDTSYNENITLADLSVGVHHIVLEVTDEDGAVDTDIVTVTVSEAGTSTSTLKKTGQTTSYYAGDDGDYQKGVTPSYSRANEVVTDNVTGLEWQDDAEAKTVTKTWAEAQTYCANLSLDGGGWRLPTVQELQSIIVDGAHNPSIDTTAFVNYTTSSYYWSSTTSAYFTSYAWIVNFYDGYTSSYSESSTYYVRCVR